MIDGNKNYEEARNLVIFQLREHSDSDEIWHNVTFQKNARRVSFFHRQLSQR